MADPLESGGSGSSGDGDESQSNSDGVYEAGPSGGAGGSGGDSGDGGAAAVGAALRDQASSDRQEFLNEELAVVRSKVPEEYLSACYPQLVQYDVCITAHKHVVCSLQFPVNYPDEVVLIELRSRVLPDDLLDVLRQNAEQAAELALGERQALAVFEMIEGFLSQNELVVAWPEIKDIQQRLEGTTATLKMNQKKGTLKLKMEQGAYFLHAVITVPHEYPTESPALEITKSNFKPAYVDIFFAHASEVIRSARCGPVNYSRKKGAKPWDPRPCIAEVVEYLFDECVRRYPVEPCQLCGDQLFPEDPNDVDENPPPRLRIERIYCGHLYHFGCLDVFMKTPPFEEGKKCPTCRHQIYHAHWTRDPRLLEQRWAHKEARFREVSEVTEFLGINEHAREVKRREGPEWLADKIKDQGREAKVAAAKSGRPKRKKKKLKLGKKKIRRGGGASGGSSSRGSRGGKSRGGGGTGADDMSAFF